MIPADARLAGTSVAGSVLDLIGATPLVHLRRTSAAYGIDGILAMKQEAANPGGSAKDRPALAMVLAGERDGLLRPGGTIVEPTSGNTGVGLAIVAAQRGYRCIFVVTDKVAPEKISLLRAYGAEVVVCPVAVAPDDERSYYRVAERLAADLGAFRPNQYQNPANPLAHETATGVEIFEQTAGRITHFVAGAGTAGTVTGVARALRRHAPHVQIIVADPINSVFSGGSGRPYLVEGVGEDFYPAAFDPSLYDRIVPVTDASSFAVARAVSRTEGILVGGSGGLALAVAIDVAAAAGPDGFVVALNPDSGRGYLSRVYDDDWMTTHGFLDATDGTTVGAVLGCGRIHDTDGGDEAAFRHLASDTTVQQAAGYLAEHRLDAVAVCDGTWPFAAAEVRGSVSVHGLAMHLQNGGRHDDTIDRCLEAPLVKIGIGMRADDAVQILAQCGTGVVYDAGHPVRVVHAAEILTRRSGRMPSPT